MVQSMQEQDKKEQSNWEPDMRVQSKREPSNWEYTSHSLALEHSLVLDMQVQNMQEPNKRVLSKMGQSKRVQEQGNWVPSMQEQSKKEQGMRVHCTKGPSS